MEDAPIRTVIYESDALVLTQIVASWALPSDNVVVTFPDMLHSGIGTGQGFAEASLAKRHISQVAVVPRRSDWFQSSDFFDALGTLRAHLGPDAQVATYGFSMGGYGAILAARKLGARLAVALGPQYSLDPTVVSGDRRFAPQAQEIGSFRWDVAAEIDSGCQYLVLHDPTHRLDSLNARMFARLGASLLPIHGARHHIIERLVAADAIEALFDVLRGRAGAGDLRRAYRASRMDNRLWLRRVAKTCIARRQAAGLQRLLALAEAQHMRGLTEDLQQAIKATDHRSRPHRQA